MSATYPTLDLQEQIARIDRNQAEIGKLLAEQPKLYAEHRKLVAEADKLRRDRFLAPVATAAAVGAVVATIMPTILRSLGVH